MTNKDSDNVYLNIRINSSAENSSNYSSILNYSVTKDKPIINNPSDYYVAVIDFEVPASLIPLWIARIIPNQPDPNKMTATFTISSPTYDPTDNDAVNVIYIPTTDDIPPIQNQPYQIITYYYFVYTYNYLLEAFNNALETAFFLAGSPGGQQYKAPYFSLTNKDRQGLQLVVSDAFINAGGKIFMNKYTGNYLSGFDYFFYDETPINTQRNLEFKFFTRNNICDENGRYDINGDYWLFEQQYYALTEWDALRKIIIYTNSIPIKNQEVTSNNLLSPDLSNQSPILFSFIPDYRTASGTRTTIYYNSAEQYKLTDLQSTNPLRKIDVQVAWQNNLGEIFAMYLQPYQSCNLQLGFFKKSLYNSSK